MVAFSLKARQAVRTYLTKRLKTKRLPLLTHDKNKIMKHAYLNSLKTALSLLGSSSQNPTSLEPDPTAGTTVQLMVQNDPTAGTTDGLE